MLNVARAADVYNYQTARYPIGAERRWHDDGWTPANCPRSSRRAFAVLSMLRVQGGYLIVARWAGFSETGQIC
jgi:hypothetical protein